MLGTTPYIALVGGGKQPKFPQNKVRSCPDDADKDWVFISTDTYEVQIWNDTKEVVSTSLEFKTPIQRVRIARSHLIVVLLNSVGIYQMKMPPVKIAEYETANNPFGLCSLGDEIVAFPGLAIGKVNLFNLASRRIAIVPAHETPLRALAVSKKCDMVATASEKGTIIRLFAYPSCTKIAEFRRGADQAAIFSLAFSPDGSMLAATSDKETLHIFEVPAGPSASKAEPDPKTHKWGILSKVPGLPRHFSDTYSSAQTKFQIGEEPLEWGPQSKSVTLTAGIPGVPGGRPTKGLIGWLDEQTVLVVGAGQDAIWEKFQVGLDDAGRRAIVREGWRNYLLD